MTFESRYVINKMVDLINLNEEYTLNSLQIILKQAYYITRNDYTRVNANNTDDDEETSEELCSLLSHSI